MSYEIHINHPTGPKDYTIYTKAEADIEGIRYVDWKVAEEGEWCLTSDNYVAEVIKTKDYHTTYHNRVNRYIKCAFGYIMFNLKSSNTKFKADGRKCNHTFSGKKGLDVSLHKEPGKNLAMAYAQVMNKDLAIDLAYPGGVGDSKRGMYKRQMRTEVFKTMVREELKALLLDSDLTEKYTLTLLKDAIDMAIAKKDVKSMLNAVKNLEDLHGMIDKNKTVTTQQIEGSSKISLIDQIGAEERKFKASQVITEDN